MMWGDGVAFMPRDVPVAALVACLRMVLGLPAPAVSPPTTEHPRGRRPPALLLDLEGWFAFVLLALPMFSGELPVAMEAALPHARQLLLALGMLHSGDSRPEILRMLDTSRRELRRLTKQAGLDVDLEGLTHLCSRAPSRDSTDG